MPSALVIGGTGFLGRHVAEQLAREGYAVTTLARGEPSVPFDAVDIEHRVGDRGDRETLATVAADVDPGVVIDTAAFIPRDVAAAVDIFDEVDAYVYVSSGGVYDARTIPKREDETPLADCTPGQARDDTMESYAARKAEGDRLARDAADAGVAAMTVRPSVLYGPETVPEQDVAPAGSGPDWIDLPVNETLHDPWIDRVDNQDRVLVPGDGTAIWHRAYVEDVAGAVRLVAEHGQPGWAYNVADSRVCTLADVIHALADALGTSVELVHTSARELAGVGLAPEDFVLYHHPATSYPHVMDTCRIRTIGWRSTSVGTAIQRTVDERLEVVRARGRDVQRRRAEARLLAELAE